MPTLPENAWQIAGTPIALDLASEALGFPARHSRLAKPCLESRGEVILDSRSLAALDSGMTALLWFWADGAFMVLG